MIYFGVRNQLIRADIQAILLNQFTGPSTRKRLVCEVLITSQSGNFDKISLGASGSLAAKTN